MELTNISEHEKTIYEYLLSNGPCTTGPIIKNTGIANSQVYRILDRLIEQGLVSYALHTDGKHFRAADPEVLLDKAEKQFERVKEHVEVLKKKRPAPDDTESAVYEGFDGFKTAFRRIIDEVPEGGTIRIIGFSPEQPALDSLRVFLKNQNLRCKEKGQKLKIVLGKSAKQTLGDDRESESFSEVRYLPDEYIGPAAVDITDDAVYTFLWDEKPYVFMLRNKRVADSYKQYFELLWRTAES